MIFLKDMCMPEVDQTQRPMREKVFVGKQHYYFVLEYVSTHKVPLSNI